MKRIINGKRYDTETAEELASYSYSNRGDFNYFRETLYRKRTGEFFIYGVGGPASKYAQAVDTNSWSGGERLMPVTYEAAQKWAEQYLTGDEYEEIFGEVAEDDSRTTMSISLPTATAEKLKRMAGASGETMSAIVDRLIREA